MPPTDPADPSSLDTLMQINGAKLMRGAVTRLTVSALMPEIEAQVAKGYPLVEIWRVLRTAEKFFGGYESFRRQVGRCRAREAKSSLAGGEPIIPQTAFQPASANAAAPLAPTKLPEPSTAAPELRPLANPNFPPFRPKTPEEREKRHNDAVAKLAAEKEEALRVAAEKEGS
jgi:hypothetical protein